MTSQGMHRVRDSAIVPIVADEGVRTAADLERHIANGACDGVAIKLSQVGGIAAAAQLADTAKQAGLLAFVTSALDGPIGLAAGHSLCCGAPDFEVANGLATGGLFLDHYATEMPRVVDGADRTADMHRALASRSTKTRLPSGRSARSRRQEVGDGAAAFSGCGHVDRV